MFIRPLFAFSIVACLSACGARGSSGANVSGTIHGQNITIEEAVSGTLSLTILGHTDEGTAIFLSASESLCENLNASQWPKNTRRIEIGVSDWDAAQQAGKAIKAPGAYPITSHSGGCSVNDKNCGTPAKTASFTVLEEDGNCKLSTIAGASSGTVNVTAVSDAMVSGTFDVVLDSGDRLTGSFDASHCAGVSALPNSKSPPACL